MLSFARAGAFPTIGSPGIGGGRVEETVTLAMLKRTSVSDISPPFVEGSNPSRCLLLKDNMHATRIANVLQVCEQRKDITPKISSAIVYIDGKTTVHRCLEN
jgi:hypothetical protein